MTRTYDNPYGDFEHGQFTPTGPLEPLTSDDARHLGYGRRFASNPGEDQLDAMLRRARAAGLPLQYTARLIIGRKIEDELIWTLDDIKAEIFTLREKAGRDPSLSILAQEGIYKGKKMLVSEPSAQVVILAFPDLTVLSSQADRDESFGAFLEEMIRMSNTAAKDLLQETIALQVYESSVLRFGDLIPSYLPDEALDPNNSSHIAEIRHQTAVFMARFK